MHTGAAWHPYPFQIMPIVSAGSRLAQDLLRFFSLVLSNSPGPMSPAPTPTTPRSQLGSFKEPNGIFLPV